MSMAIAHRCRVPARRSRQTRGRALVARAHDVIDRLVSGDVEPLILTFNDKMKAAIDADGLRRWCRTLAAQVGAFKTRNGARTESQGGLRVVLVSCAFERANVDFRVAFDSFDRIVGIGFRPPAPTVAYTAPAYVTPTAFRDEAFTVDAGGWPLPGTLVTASRRRDRFPEWSSSMARDRTTATHRSDRTSCFAIWRRGWPAAGSRCCDMTSARRTHAARVATLRDFTVKEEVVDDAVAAVRKMRETARIRADRVFVLGHSLGGMLAPRIAAADPSIAGLILMAAAVKPLEQSIVDQTRYLAMLDGKVSVEEQAAAGCRHEARRRCSRAQAIRPTDRVAAVQRTRVVLARLARLQPACRGEPSEAADAGPSRGARLPSHDGGFCSVAARAGVARRCAIEIVSGAESFVHGRIRTVLACRIRSARPRRRDGRSRHRRLDHAITRPVHRLPSPGSRLPSRLPVPD